MRDVRYFAVLLAAALVPLVAGYLAFRQVPDAVRFARAQPELVVFGMFLFGATIDLAGRALRRKHR